MKLLALNTAGKNTQLGFVIDNKEYSLSAGFSRHSESLFPLLSEMCEEHKIALSSLDCFACVIGPGSFTGIRIGMSVAKGFGLALNKPLIAINSLELLAYTLIDESDKICAVINAGAGLVYHQTFRVQISGENKMLVPLVNPRVDKINHFKGYISANYNDEVALIYNNNGEKVESGDFGESQDFLVESLIAVAKYKFQNGDFCNAVTLNPLYLRVSQAEQMLGELKLRRASIDDLDAILALENQGDEWDLQWNEIGIRQSFDNPNYRCYLYENGEEAKGFVSVMMLAGEAEILRVVVHANARLQGVASKMLGDLIETLRVEGVSAIFLEVNSLNYPAYSLYKKLGFAEIGRREEYYEHGQDAVLMRLDL